MAIKSRVIDLGDGQNKTEYLYAVCKVQGGEALSLKWEEDSSMHRDVIKSKGASNELQLLEVDDSIDDDIMVKWLQVDATADGDSFVYDVSRVDASRDSHYMDELRSERDSLLKDCDWEVMKHRDQVDNSETADLSAQEYSDLLAYRKALRDWPSDETDIYNRTAPIRA